MSEERVEGVTAKRKSQRDSVIQSYLEAILDELSAGLRHMCARVAKAANENLRKVRQEHEEARTLNDRTQQSNHRLTCPLQFPNLSPLSPLRRVSILFL